MRTCVRACMVSIMNKQKKGFYYINEKKMIIMITYTTVNKMRKKKRHIILSQTVIQFYPFVNFVSIKSFIDDLNLFLEL